MTLSREQEPQRYLHKSGMYDAAMKGFRPEMMPSDTGDWILYADYAALRAEVERYKHLALVNDACEREVKRESSKDDLYEQCLFLMKKASTLTAENERLAHRIHELENMESVYGVLRDQATIESLRAQVTALEQKLGE